MENELNEQKPRTIPNRIKVCTWRVLWTLTALCFVASPAQAKYAPVLKSIPIFIEPAINAVSLNLFWLAMAAHGAVSIAKELAEPLENYEAGIWHSSRSTSSTISWPDGDYPSRNYDVETNYDYDPFTHTIRWFIKSTFTVINRDGTSTATITYSQTPPVVVQFNVENCHYQRVVLAGSHSDAYAYDSFETLTGYCIRRGSAAWGRPVTAFFHGWEWTMLVRSDIIYHNPTVPYDDNHHLFIGPASLGNSSLGLFKLKKQKDTPGGAEVNAVGVVTLFFTPADIGL